MYWFILIFLNVLNTTVILANPISQNSQDLSVIDIGSLPAEQPIKNDDLISTNNQNDIVAAGCTSGSSTNQVADDDDETTGSSQGMSIFRRLKEACPPQGFLAPPAPRPGRKKILNRPSPRLQPARPSRQSPSKDSNDPCTKENRDVHVTCGGPEVRIESLTDEGVRIPDGALAFILNCVAGKSRSRQSLINY